MAKKFYNETYIRNIADAIRSKLGVQTQYKVSQMADAIGSIPTGITPTGTKEITANGTNIDVAQYEYADVAVPNSYAAGDEGKVVSNGALVSQTSQNITQNGTYDTTLKNEVVVNVSGGGGGAVLLTPVQFDSTAGYPETGNWQSSSTGNIRTDVYEVDAGKAYFIHTGSVVGNRLRVGFSSNNPIVDGHASNYEPIYINSTSSIANWTYVYGSNMSGFILINKTSDGTNNLVCEVYEVSE